MATVITSDKIFFNIHQAFVDDCNVLKMFHEESDDVIPLVNIDAATFIRIYHFFRSGKLAEYETVKSVIVAADYLAYDRLIDHCAEYIASQVIKGMSPQQIKKYFENI